MHTRKSLCLCCNVRRSYNIVFIAIDVKDELVVIIIDSTIQRVLKRAGLSLQVKQKRPKLTRYTLEIL